MQNQVPSFLNFQWKIRQHLPLVLQVYPLELELRTKVDRNPMMQEPNTNSIPKNEGGDTPKFLLNVSVTRDMTQQIRFYNPELSALWTIRAYTPSFFTWMLYRLRTGLQVLRMNWKYRQHTHAKNTIKGTQRNHENGV